MERTQLAIVGASAAGLAAAVKAAEEGLDVTLIEAKDQIGIPPAPAITAMDFLWPDEIDRPDHTVTRRLAGTRLRGSDGRGPFVDGPISLVDRTRFDQHLAARAESLGVQVITGVKEVDARPDRSLVADGLETRPDILMFADGARSQVTRFFQATRHPESMQWVGVMTFEAPEPHSDGRIYSTLGAHAPGGRSQLNPLGDDRWSHWTFFRGKQDEAEDYAREALRLDADLMGWKDLDARFMGAGPDPLYTLPDRLVGDRVVATGGAAGQGGFEVGLASGLMAGAGVAKTLKGDGKLVDYERAWMRRWYKKYENLRRSNDALLRLTDEEVRRVVGAWDGRHVGDKPRLGEVLGNPRGVLELVRVAKLARKRRKEGAQTL